ncbi:MAG: M23 family metallopeptidase [Acidimicrobiia bacterium]|nr:M23 family metallopeptidase [Acidimicrobiia bacterium]
MPSETPHIVRAGETLSGVAAAHGVDPNVLARSNGITNGRLTAGVRLQLAPLRVPFDPSAAGTHVIAAGESVASIAKAHGTTVEGLMNLNHIHAGESLEAGQSMRISSGWLCPVPGAQFANDWGWVKHDGRTHEGVDVFANHGAAIVAPVAGHLHQDEGPSGGLQFTLWGDDGVVYFGSHMDSFGASGDVSAGETIGTIGSTGNAAGTSPHLHFEVHTSPTDRTANPYPALVAACK